MKKFEQRPYYKMCLFLENKKEYFSINAFNKFCLQYELNKETRSIPGSLGLFVFDSLESVFGFSASKPLRRDTAIFECRVRGPVITCTTLLLPSKMRVFRTIWSRARRLESIKRSRYNHPYSLFGTKSIIHDYTYRTLKAPRNTFSVAALKPTKLISREQLSEELGKVYNKKFGLEVALPKELKAGEQVEVEVVREIARLDLRSETAKEHEKKK